ncbi:hypothetical protein DFP72DRAFT_1135225 [Ephemerocybe angulata]|uniref:Uncharacterized protein n=1 Tax=Ephemerocybe angulata TaxID=980116 RepID=A0A8H6HSE2_9AGAR|nr:hypothetical protein DFP72DRAFT_1135225 [Tulosesus angulatus]
MNDTTATTRVLLVPELFDMVIREMDQGTLAKAARVNKHCSEAALSCLWESQADLKPLFNLLATKGYELKDNKLRSSEATLQSKAGADSSNTAEGSSRSKSTTRKSATFLLDTFAVCTSSTVPHWREWKPVPIPSIVRWTGATEISLLHRSVLFMHPGIRKFYVTLPSSVHTLPGDALCQYFDHVIGRMPNIVHIAVIMKRYAAVVEPSVLQLIKGHKKSLENLEVPKYWTSSALIEILSSLPHFRNLQIRTSQKSVGVYDPARRFRPTLLPNVAPWRSSEKLHLSAPSGEVTDFLRRNTLPPSVVELFIYTAHQVAFSAQVADCLSIGDFIPLFTAIPLTEFCFHHEFPMFFKDFSLGGPGFAPFDMNDTLIFLRSQPWSTAATYSLWHPRQEILILVGDQ